MNQIASGKFVKKVLIGSPVYQEPEILKEFLLSLDELNKGGFDVFYFFIDDNENQKSQALLKNFADTHHHVIIKDGKKIAGKIEYICDDFTHRWNENLVQKVTTFKNGMIEYAKEHDFDYLFLIDSDLVLHPKTLQQLAKSNKDIISNIFWTQWNPSVAEMPQVWLKDAYTMHNYKSNQNITTLEVQRQTDEFLRMLRKPGVYKVGGLGACTLISNHAINKGISFDDIYNLSFWGEDRHFCVRAVALGLELFVDTHYPAYHIYRNHLLSGVKDYKKTYYKRDTEILGSKILDIIVEGVNAFGSYSYLTKEDDSWIKYYTEDEGRRLKKIRREERKKAVEEKIINRVNVKECTMTFYNDNELVGASVHMIVSGYKQLKSFYHEMIGKVEAKKINDQFLISNFEFEKEIDLNFIPLVRVVREEPKLTLSMIVKNEEKRYLKKALESARQYIDNAVIIDDASTDKTISVIRSTLKNIPTKIIENKQSKFSNEIDLRKQQWFETIRQKPDWILFLDADEIFEDKFKQDVQRLIRNFDFDVYMFRLFDFWSEEYFRDDKLWNAHNTFRPFLIRYQRNFNYQFTETSQHCGRMPSNVTELNSSLSYLRLKHFGWAKEEDRIAKYKRYMELDPDGRFGSLEQYRSILDENPMLSKWNERE